MTPITPERFIEILVTAKNVKLYDLSINKWFDCNGIELTGKYWHATSLTINSKLTCLRLDDLYESKPETPLDELDEILNDGSMAYMKQVYAAREWRDEYESQLKELK